LAAAGGNQGHRRGVDEILVAVDGRASVGIGASIEHPASCPSSPSARRPRAGPRRCANTPATEQEAGRKRLDALFAARFVPLRYNQTVSQASVLDPVPLVFPDDGSAIRVAGTRLTLDTIVGAFKQGATAEEIAQDFPPVSLPDVYAVIAYYLRHRDDVEGYLETRAREHAELRREIEDRPEYQELRKRLLARVDEVKAPR
jgi:uncharacterized protein (DUF433 family)